MIVVEKDTSFQQVDDYQIRDGGNSSGLLNGNDTVHLYIHYIQSDGAWETEVDNTPITILEEGSFNEVIHNPGLWGGTIGLGPDSTLLQTLHDRDMISSKSFALDVGTGFDRAGGALNGSITLGGYDSSKFSDPISTYQMQPNPSNGNPFVVSVRQITLNDVGSSNSTVTLLDDDSSFDASLTTDQYPITLPSAALSTFISTLNAFSDNTTTNDDSLILPERFKGSMTITLSSNFSITFSSEWLSNISNITPISSTPCTSDESTTCLLGTSFLTSIYLLSSYTASEFHLAPLIRDSPFITTEAWCADTTPTPYSNPHISSFARNGGPGIVIGAVFGGLALLVVLSVLWKYMKRGRKRRVKFVDGVKGGIVESDDWREERWWMGMGKGKGGGKWWIWKR
ncbi:putative peptidase a1 [Phaeomoniella chlamydospora]|uniref:Putative peptidase a1 n=1 Tax=Phaeomoniella chlamydospora TaxID=158046 RepID=A0A0G2H1B7_PHACM|nr:putative peptidase a1 [Phaeomoniella chlamydospora]